MSDLPYGWSDRYALTHTMSQVKQLTEAVGVLTERLAVLEAELTRLDVTKADRKGRKPQPTAQGDLRDIPKLGETRERAT